MYRNCDSQFGLIAMEETGVAAALVMDVESGFY